MRKLIKKWYFWIVPAFVLSVTLIIIISNRSNTTLNPGEKNFAITDTASVTKIFLADKNDNKVLLERTDSAGWLLNSKYTAQPEMVQELLYTLMYVSVSKPVPKKERDNAIKLLASFSTKVEVYATVYFIDFWGIRLFPYEKKIRTYYVGFSTKDNTGTYMLMEDAETPFVTHIPGFKGFLHPRYSPLERDWRNHQVFRYTLPQIAEVNVEYPQHPSRSFVLENPDNINFSISNPEKGKLKVLDTVKVISYLNAYTDVRFETFLDVKQTTADSIRKLLPFCIISVKDRQMRENRIALIRIKAPEGSLNIFGEPVEFDPDRMWAIVNGKELVTAQYFVFGALMRYYSQFSSVPAEESGDSQNFQTIL